MDPVAIGVKQQNNKYLVTTSDFNYFNPTQRTILFGAKRYGIGYGEMQLSEVVGIHARAANGVFIYDQNGLNLSIQPFSGEFSVYTNRAWNNNYIYQPGVTGGLHISGLVVNVKSGQVFTNYFRSSGITHDQYNMHGYEAYFTLSKVVGIGYDVSRFNGIERRMVDLSLMNVIHMNIEEDSMQKSMGVGIRYGY